MFLRFGLKPEQRTKMFSGFCAAVASNDESAVNLYPHYYLNYVETALLVPVNTLGHFRVDDVKQPLPSRLHQGDI